MGSKQESMRGAQTHSNVDTAKSEAPREEIPSRIQGSVGIGVLGLGERHTNGAREARKAQQF
jgi:hypothetical protein